MVKVNITEAAKILGVSKKTLIRLDEDGRFPAEREDNGYRVYNKEDIEKHAFWFALRRKHKEHNRKLKRIRAEVDKYISTQPLGPFPEPKFHKLEDMKKAFESLRAWEKQHKEILKEYEKIPRGFKAKTDIN